MYVNKTNWEALIGAYAPENDPLVNKWSIDDILKDSSSSDSEDDKTVSANPGNPDNINFKGMSTRWKYSYMAKIHGPIGTMKKKKPVDKEYDKKVVKQYVNALD